MSFKHKKSGEEQTKLTLQFKSGQETGLWEDCSTEGADFALLPVGGDTTLPPEKIIWEISEDSPSPEKEGAGVLGHFEWLLKEENFQNVNNWLKSNNGFGLAVFHIDEIAANYPRWEKLEKQYGEKIEFLIALDKWDNLGSITLPEDLPGFAGFIIEEPVPDEALAPFVLLTGDWTYKRKVKNWILSVPEAPASPLPVITSCITAWRVLGKKMHGVQLVSCPTCSRVHGNMRPMAHEISKALKNISEPIEVAVMGCEVNGPGEAAATDVGIALGKNVALLYRNGEIKKRVPLESAVSELLAEVKDFLKEKEQREE